MHTPTARVRCQEKCWPGRGPRRHRQTHAVAVSLAHGTCRTFLVVIVPILGFVWQHALHPINDTPSGPPPRPALHGPPTAGVFIYGNALDGEAHMASLLYAKLVSLNNPFFTFNACNYTEKNMSRPDKDGSSKEGAGRVALYKQVPRVAHGRMQGGMPGCVRRARLQEERLAGVPLVCVHGARPTYPQRNGGWLEGRAVDSSHLGLSHAWL